RVAWVASAWLGKAPKLPHIFQTEPSETAKNAGWLLKAVVAKDRRRFDTKKEAQTRQYRWTEDLGTD
ncbi:MAG: hypothetical protein AAFY55_18560, partial [Bacteroidota bacterium]